MDLPGSHFERLLWGSIFLVGGVIAVGNCGGEKIKKDQFDQITGALQEVLDLPVGEDGKKEQD